MDRKKVLMLAKKRSEFFRQNFVAWLHNNFDIFERFCREAEAIAARGRRHYSARTIGEFLRHETSLRDDSEWKINDHVWPDLARLYMFLYPHRKDFFEFRMTGYRFREVAGRRRAA